jgi:perosamine synthetase
MKVLWSKPDFSSEEHEAAFNSIKNYIGANGPEVANLEKEFAAKVGSKHAIAVCNGTAALMLSLMCMRHMYGDLKIGVPSFTFIASANSSYQIFGKKNVKLLDCNIDTWNTTIEDVCDDIDLLMTVDVGGLPCDYTELSKLNVPIIADSAESIGSVIDNQVVGSQAAMHCFSLHRAKVVSCGEGGMVTTNSDELYELAKSLLNHGYSKNKHSHEYIHDNYGVNFRMSDVSAAIARVQLRKLSKFVSHRNKIANIYKQELRGLADFQVYDSDRLKSNYFFFGIRVEDRPRVINSMYRNGIQVKTWTAVHKQPIWNDVELPNASAISDSVVLLPIHNLIEEEEVEYTIKKLKEIL